MADPPRHRRPGHYNEVMFLVDLVCGDGHLFEGWYDNRLAFDEARHDGLSCPVCQGTDVEVRPSFRAVIGSRSSSSMGPADEARAGGAGSPLPDLAAMPALPAVPMPIEVQKALSQLLKHVRANTEDAGERFAERAIAMHRGDEAPAAIHGTSTPEERARLADEGVPFMAVPIPDIDQN